MTTFRGLAFLGNFPSEASVCLSNYFPRFFLRARTLRRWTWGRGSGGGGGGGGAGGISRRRRRRSTAAGADASSSADRARMGEGRRAPERREAAEAVARTGRFARFWFGNSGPLQLTVTTGIGPPKREEGEGDGEMKRRKLSLAAALTMLLTVTAMTRPPRTRSSLSAT